MKEVKSTNLRKTWDGIPIAGCTTPTIKCGRSQRNFAIYTFIQLFNFSSSPKAALDAPCKAMNPSNGPERPPWSLSGVGWSYRVMVGGWLDFHPDSPNRLSHGEPMVVETASVLFFLFCTILGPGIEPWSLGSNLVEVAVCTWPRVRSYLTTQRNLAKLGYTRPLYCILW